MVHSYFNSIKVRLEQQEQVMLQLKHLHFNSIKVRLERVVAKGKTPQFRGFQFHKGTIRTLHAFWQLHTIDLFQFHKGTIRTYLCPPKD